MIAFLFRFAGKLIGKPEFKEDVMLKVFRSSALILGLFALTSCNSLTPTQEKTLAGGAAGAAAGTVGTLVLGGCVPCGAALGGAVGAGTSYAIHQVEKMTQ